MSRIALIEPARVTSLSVAGSDDPALSEASFCVAAHEAGGRNQVFEVADTQLDPRFSAEELVTKPNGVRFYAGVRLVTGGRYVGTLCVLGTEPNSLTPEQKADLLRLARIAEEMLGLQLLTTTRATLLKVITEHEQTSNELQVQRGRAVRKLAHELSTTLAAIRITTESLQAQDPPSPIATQIHSFVSHAAEADALLRDLRLISSPYDDDPALMISPQPLAPIVERAGTGLFTLLTNDTIEFNLEDIEAPVDEHALHRLLTNLLAYIVSQNSAGTHICIGLRSTETDVVLEITDDEPRPEQDADAEEDLIAANVVEKAKTLIGAHGGNIEIVDRERMGQAITITLPAGAPATQV